MKNLKNTALVVIATIALVGCSKDEQNEVLAVAAIPSAQAFQGIRATAVLHQTQTFTATAGTGLITLTSAKGVIIKINGNNLTKNGNPVTGAIDIKFIELFDKGTMLVTNKPTMGLMGDGNKGILLSGGEFFLDAKQAGVALVSTSQIQLTVPVNLAGEPMDNTMTFWAGNTTDADNLTWEKPGAVGTQHNDGAVGFGQNSYNVSFGNFGWTNIDRFYSDPRPKTQILATVPVGYNNTNCSIYLSVDGEGQNQLAKFDTYNPTTQQFSEHYGQIPIGLLCHIIFATEDNGQWRYAIKAVTTTANAVYAFSLSETTLGTEAQMIAAINAIQ